MHPSKLHPDQTPCVTVIDENGEPDVLYAAWPKQLEYHQRPESNVLFWGGRGSGKSLCGRWDAHMRAMAQPGFKYCILRQTYPELMSSHLNDIGVEMEKLGGESKGFKWNATDKIATYPNGSRGFFRHCANDADVLKLLSAEYGLMFFDELSTFQWEHYTLLAASARVTKDSGLMAVVRAATNPLGRSAGDVMQYYVNKDVDPLEDTLYNPNDYYSIHANVEDNPSLERKTYLKRGTKRHEPTRGTTPEPPHVIKAWVDGEFLLENALFDFKPMKKVMVDGDEKKIPYHVIPDFDFGKILRHAQIYRAIDAGWFPDPTVCLWIAHLGNRHIVFHEETWLRTTAAEVATQIKEIDKRLAAKVSPDFEMRVAITYCDPSMDIHTTADIRTIKEIYEANGVPMEASINDREHFALSMHNALAEEAMENVPRLQIYGRACPMLVKTIPMMAYDPKHPERMADHKHDHWVITACYYIMSHASDPRMAMISQSKPKRWQLPKNDGRFVLGSSNIRSSNLS